MYIAGMQVAVFQFETDFLVQDKSVSSSSLYFQDIHHTAQNVPLHLPYCLERTFFLRKAAVSPVLQFMQVG